MPDYTTVPDVARHLGRTLTSAQEAEAAALIPAATAWINGRLGGVWPQTAAQTDEYHLVEGPLVFLRYRPVASLASVSVRGPWPGTTATALVANTEYELLDATRGILRVSVDPGYEIRVTYTPNATAADPRLKLAARHLVAFWLRPLVEGVTGDIKSYSIGEELQVTYRDDAGTIRGVPSEVVALVDGVGQSLGRGFVVA